MDTCWAVRVFRTGGVSLKLTSGTSTILLAVVITNLVCGYLLGVQSVTHCL